MVLLCIATIFASVQLFNCFW